MRTEREQYPPAADPGRRDPTSVTGANPGAQYIYLFGLDYLILEPVEGAEPGGPQE